MPFDSGLIGAIHVERLARADAAGDAAMPHVVFQTSTIDGLLDSAYEGDLTLGELGAHGDLGLGTVQQLDGELIVLDGRFYRADSGAVNELALETRTPFAVVVPFAPEAVSELFEPAGLAGLYARLNELAPSTERCVAVRFDGCFQWLKLRSLARRPARRR